nr:MULTISPECIES: hypothetical protein [unclassified Mesorhizobium]
MRPEDLAIASDTDYLFERTVDYVEQLGEVQLVYIDIGRADLPLVTKLPGNVEVRRGSTLPWLDQSADRRCGTCAWR